jgi:predicted HicB family RNase H-like nuclease
LPIHFSLPSKQTAIDPTAWVPLKRVIEGKAYNTETASLIHEHLDEVREEDAHEYSFDPYQYPYAEQLFRTRFGKYFLVIRNEAYLNPANDDVELRDRLLPLDQDQATKWMEKNCSEKIFDYMVVPEAGDSNTTLTLRLDKLLKIRLNAAAIKEGVSMNLWCIQKLEAAIADYEAASEAHRNNYAPAQPSRRRPSGS